MSVKRVLVCSFYTPQTDRDSGSRSISDFIDFLLELGWKVSFIATNALGEMRYVRALQRRGVAVYDGSNTPVAELVAASRFDLALLVSWPIAELYLPVIRRISPATRVIVQSLDLHFLRDARRIFHTPAENRDYSLLDAGYAAQIIGELNTYAAADGVLTVSQKEADLVDDLIGDATLAYVASDAEDLQPSCVSYPERKGIVFVGDFRHPPNLQAVEYLCKEVLPRLDPAILAQHPISIVGNGLNETVRSYGSVSPHIRMVGWVPSITPYFEHARISVIPLLHGAGTKRKLVQALMTGTPTVSTSIGTEGLELYDGKHVLIADDPAAFAASIVRLLGDEDLWQCLAREGYAHISAIYSREAARARFVRAIDAVLAKEPKPAILADSSPELYQQRVRYQYHQQLIPHIQVAIRKVVPPDATIVVVSEGYQEFLKLGERKAWHFLQNVDGEYADGYPADSDAAIAQLEALRSRGGAFLLFPGPSFWWFDYYPDFKLYLERHYREVARQNDTYLIYALHEPLAEIRQLAEIVVKPDEATAHNGNGSSKENLPMTRTISGHANSVYPELVAGIDHTDSARAAVKPGESGDVRLIAFYLPQFHPIPENNIWWGEGFTEWTNVAKAQPLFRDHYQPHIPADLGFYDLRLPEVRRMQAEVARAYGIYGFCYYHYWFNGTRLLERPFNEILASGEPNFPFCLCWANEPWTRRWDGRDRDILQPQSYSDEDDVTHITWLIPALRDPRAITIEGKPVFMVYQAKDLPNPARTAEIWRREVLKAGLRGIYLITVETGWDSGWDATKEGFDAKVLFQPQFTPLFAMPSIPVPGQERLRVYDYQKAWPILANPEPVAYRRYDTVFPGWDNSPRTGENATVLHNSTPEAYEQWLRHAITKAQSQPPDHRIVFINAWNEWGEGTHLEPDLCHGYAYLEATSRALGSQKQREPKAKPPHLVSHAWNGTTNDTASQLVLNVGNNREKLLRQIGQPTQHLPQTESLGPEQLFSEGEEGRMEVPWIAMDTVYEFRLYAGDDHTTLLAAVSVTRKDAAFLIASPNPVPVGPGLGTTTISWSTGDGAWGQVYIVADDRPEQLFSEGEEGRMEVPWIAMDTVYEFRLYAGDDHTTLLAAVSVTRKDAAFLITSPNPVPIGPGLGTTTISWSTGDGAWGQVYVATHPISVEHHLVDSKTAIA